MSPWVTTSAPAAVMPLLGHFQPRPFGYFDPIKLANAQRAGLEMLRLPDGHVHRQARLSVAGQRLADSCKGRAGRGEIDFFRQVRMVSEQGAGGGAGDEEARARGTQKSILERKAPPTFPLVIEMRERAAWVTHWTEDSVDALLHSVDPTVQLRRRLPGTPPPPQMQRSNCAAHAGRPETQSHIEQSYRQKHKAVPWTRCAVLTRARHDLVWPLHPGCAVLPRPECGSQQHCSSAARCGCCSAAVATGRPLPEIMADHV